MKISVFQKGFNYSQDGPGNRLVLHLQGCNMQCPWCANPEGMECVHPIRPPQVYEAEELLEEIDSCRTLFFDGGGVTFSGGEPTLQFESLLFLLKKLQDQGIDTALETNGTHPGLKELFPYLRLLIMDLKQIDAEVHKLWTGISNETVKKNIGNAMSMHPNVLIRTPLIGGVNSDSHYIQEFIKFYKQFPLQHTWFELLKYHEYGKVKWEQCGKRYHMENGHITDEILELYEETYREAGLTVVRT